MIRTVVLLLGVSMVVAFGGERVTLRNGDVYEDVQIEAAANAAYVSLISDFGVTRVPKSELPEELAAEWGYEPKLSGELVARESEARLDLAAREEIRGEVEDFWKRNAVEISLSCFGEGNKGETTAEALRLGEFETVRVPTVTALGNRGLGVEVTKRRRSALGRIFIEGLPDGYEAGRPVWAVRVGTRLQTETVYSEVNGFETLERSVPVFTADKEAAFLSSIDRQ
jgi:hypothetical protein